MKRAFLLLATWLPGVACLVHSQTIPNIHGLGNACWSGNTENTVPLSWNYEMLGAHVTGHCNIKVTEKWFTCLLEHGDGSVSGTLNRLHQRAVIADATATPEQGLLCELLPESSASHSSDFRMTIVPHAKSIGATAVFEKCQLEPCLDKSNINATSTLDGSNWRLSWPKHEDVLFSKFESGVSSGAGKDELASASPLLTPSRSQVESRGAKPADEATPLAKDKDFCTDLNVYGEAAAKSFAEVKGKQDEKNEEVFALMRPISGFDNCRIWIYKDGTTPSAVCEARSGTDVATLASVVRSCLGPGWRESKMSISALTIIFTNTNAVRVRVRGRADQVKLWIDAPEKD